MIQKFTYAITAILALGACDPLGPQSATDSAASTKAQKPQGAAPGTCWGRDDTPAVIDTITEKILVTAAEVSEDGTVINPAIYTTKTRQEISVARREIWFETPCHDILDAEFVATLQRALAARNLYRGTISGKLDTRTRRAIRRYQEPLDLDSAILSLEAARKLGLIAVKRAETGK